MIGSGESTDPVEVARYVLRVYERSGYGTPKPDRYCPTFRPEDVVLLAKAVLDGTTLGDAS